MAIHTNPQFALVCCRRQGKRTYGVQLVLLLLGAQAVQRHWLRLAVVGLVWTALGLVVITDPLDGVQDITMDTLGALLVIEGTVRLLVALLSGGKPPP